MVEGVVAAADDWDELEVTTVDIWNVPTFVVLTLGARGLPQQPRVSPAARQQYLPNSHTWRFHCDGVSVPLKVVIAVTC